MSILSNPNHEGWNRNTDLGCNVKTILRNDRRMTTGKHYHGMLCRDSEGVVDDFLFRDPHYTFVETLPSTDGKRNPRVFEGKYITITCRDDGTYRLNFKRVVVGKDFPVDGFAIGVCNELREALKGLVEKE